MACNLILVCGIDVLHSLHKMHIDRSKWFAALIPYEEPLHIFGRRVFGIMNRLFQMGDHLKFETVVFGCGNPLFGDDGFGSVVIEYLLQHFRLPPSTVALDVGTAVREFLIDMLLSPQKPDRMLLIDAMDMAPAEPGTIRSVPVHAIPPAKIHDVSLHQFPTTNLLQELQSHTGMDIRLLVVQPGPLPDRVAPGLSAKVQAAVRPMCERIITILQEDRPAGRRSPHDLSNR